MMSPMMNAIHAVMRTAPAATSFVSRAYGWYSGLVRSMSISIAVLKVSAAKNVPIAKTRNIHSIDETCIYKPRATTIQAKKILRPLSCFTNKTTPRQALSARLKLKIFLFFSENSCMIIVYTPWL